MQLKITKSWLRVSLALLAACLSGVVFIQAAEKPAQPGDVSGAPAKHLKAKEGSETKKQDQNPAKANQKEPADSASEIAQLKKQLALQQKQIAQLLQAVNKLQAVVAAGSRPAVAASVPQPSRSVATESITQPSSGNEVASLTPILPPLPKSQPADANQVLAVNTPVNLPQAKGSAESASQMKTSSRPAVSGAVSAPAGKAPRPSPLTLDNGKLRIGATFYGFYRYFPRTGFGPQTLDNTDIHPGPGNNGFNEFNINRTYINFYYSPNDALTFRVTPNVYRAVAGVSAKNLSSTSAAGASVNGNLAFRLKYAYVDFNKLFSHSKVFGKDKVTFGQTQQPLTDWEEGLYGYRFVNLTPWNYWSVSSTYPGVKIHGPIEFNGKQYLDYDVGVFNDQSYHAYEVGERKQVMARLSYYPLGAVSKYQGIGLTGFVDYGYKDAAPDQNITVPFTRVAALVHYQSKSGDYGIAGEYDYGRNAFSSGHQFSGSAPADQFGLGPTIYAQMDSLAKALLDIPGAKQQGFDLFGHARIGKSPFYLFGMLAQFNPNTNVSKNPFDFQTIIGGISYKYGKFWQFALDSQNIVYNHSQFTFPASELSIFSPSLAAGNPNGIANAVPTDTNAIFFNVLFNY
jgi:hypothetical protein